MARNKNYATEQAIPAWMIVKNLILETSISTKRSLSQYRKRTNHRDFQDFQNGVISIYDLIRDDYDNDKKLQKNFPKTDELKKYLLNSRQNNQSEEWWLERYMEMTGILWSLGITRITREVDDDDDFAGVDDI